MMIENEKNDESLRVNECMRRLKHWLVFITFGVPLFFFLLNLLIWPSKWMDMYTNPISIQLIWSSVVPVTALMLIFTEAYGDGVKTCKYYYFVTLFAYESIWFLSIANLAYTLMNTWSIEEYIKELQNMPHCKPASLVSMSKLFYVMTCGFACFLHWIKNTFVHVSLCQSKFSGQEPNRAQYDYNHRLFWFIEYFLPLIFVILSSILIIHNNMAFTPGHGFFLPIYYVACITVSKAYVSNKFFMGKNQLYKLILPAVCCCVFILIKIKLELLADYELGYPDGIFFWICCLSIGRQWFLDMEIYPRKYENHFKNKLGIVSTVSTVTA